MKRLLKRVIGFFLKNVCFYFIPHQKNQIVPYEEAKRILNSHSPEPGTASLRKNTANKIEYDLSVIVPVYNAEKYLDQCISSILAQKTQYSYQVILVNDGSKDCSWDILCKYSLNEKVELIHQENQGVSTARNNGLRAACGRYIMFVDSDDYLPDNAIESLMHTAYNLHMDIVQGGYITINESAQKQIGTVKYADTVNVPPNGVVTGMPWGKVYSTILFSEVCFPEGYWYEDTIVTSIVTHLAKGIATTSDIVYFYRNNPSGLTQIAKKRPKSIDSYYVLQNVLTARKQLAMNTNQAFYEHLLRLVLLCYQRTKSEPREVKKSIFSLFQKMLLDERGTELFNVQPKYKKLEQTILDGDYRRYCFLCAFCK